jgi:hypothetical protein
MMPPHDDLTGGATMRSLDDPPGGSAARPQERLSGGPMARHDLDPVSLVFGFAFTGLGLLFLIGQADQALRVRWVWPVLLLVLGLGILFDVARSRDRTDRTPSPEPTLTPEPDAEPTHAPDPDPGSARAPDPDPGSDADPDLAPEPDPDPEVVVDRREQPS